MGWVDLEYHLGVADDF
jgi:hypothetical protein